MMRGAVAVDHQVLISGNAAVVIRNIEASVIVVNERVASFAVVVVSIRAEIQVAIGGSAFRALLGCPGERRHRQHRNDHKNGQKRRKQSRALGFENCIHISFSSFHFWGKEKALRYFSRGLRPFVVVVLCEYKVDGVGTTAY